MNVLVVAPSTALQEAITGLLAGGGFTAAVAASGASAMALLAEGDWGCVCASHVLPDMTGLELFQACRQGDGQASPPFVLLLDADDPALRGQALAAGVAAVFLRDDLKPLLPFIRSVQNRASLDAQVLLVSQDAAHRQHCGQILARAGCRVTSPLDAAAAIAASEQGAFDVAVLDMPPDEAMGGLVRQLRRQFAGKGQMPILALAPHADLDQQQALRQQGVSDYVLKPVTELELITRLRNLIAAHGLASRRNERPPLTTAQTLLRAIEQVTSAVAIADAEGRIEYANPRFASLVGSTAEALAGQSIAAFDSSPEGLPSQPQTREQLKRRADGSTYWAYETVAPVRDDAGQVTHYVDIHDDITETRELQDQLAYHAIHDHLTGLLNRHELERHIELALAVAHAGRGNAALILLDISHLRMLNDAFGYQAGDTLLREIGSHLARHQVNGLLAARVQSGRLALFVPQTSAREAADLAELVLEDLTRVALSWGTRHVQIGVVAGIAMLEASVDSSAEVFRRADTACHVARDAGGGKAVVYSDDDPRIVSRHGARQWLPTLRKALEQEGFRLYAQLIHPLQNGERPGLEILLRLADDQGGIIGPVHFLPAAEHYGLMPRIDRYVLDHVLNWVAAHPKEAQSPYYSINLSGQSLSNSSFMDYALERIRSSGVPVDQLCFEVTESVLARSGISSEFIARLRQDGCRFAMDDFGSGFASYGQLRRMPVEILKIDGQFVRLIAHDEVDRTMVRSMGDIGRVMGMKTVAEYVEDAATLDILREIGIDYAQGYHLGRPEPLQGA